MSDEQQPVDAASAATTTPKAKKPVAKPAKAQPKLPPMKAAIISGVNAALEKAKSDVRTNTADEVEYLAEVGRWVPTGIHWLDLVLSKGRGLPCGRPIEVFGNEGSGKTALCEYLMGRYVHEVGSPPHLLDYERAYDQEHMDCYAVAKRDILTPEPLNTIEDGWNYLSHTLDVLADRRLEAEAIGAAGDPPTLFVWDSIAQASPRAEMEEEDHGDSHMALAARAFAKGFRKILRSLSVSDATVLFINQVRDNPGAYGPGDKTVTPGGRAAKFAFTIRMKLAAVEQLKKGDRIIGQLVEVSTKKNKHAPKGMKCKIVLSYKRGIDADWSNFLFFKTFGYLLPAGTLGYRWKGAELPPFKKNGWRAFADANAELVEAARLAIFSKEMAPMDDGDDQASPTKRDESDDE
ncbi:MAG: hypothetical protein H0X45_02660 [Planctomycetes bacterium]|nr:hypothetical protein [Planctomycetota bacterium]